MMQVPGDTSVSVVPLTVHTEEVLVMNCTVSPDVAVADRADGVTSRFWAAGCVKLMVCATCATVTLRVTDVAAL